MVRMRRSWTSPPPSDNTPTVRLDMGPAWVFTLYGQDADGIVELLRLACEAGRGRCGWRDVPGMIRQIEDAVDRYDVEEVAAWMNSLLGRHALIRFRRAFGVSLVEGFVLVLDSLPDATQDGGVVPCRDIYDLRRDRREKAAEEGAEG